MKQISPDTQSSNPFFAQGIPSAPQAAPAQFSPHCFRKTWRISKDREQVWEWLNNPSTFTDGQVPPYRVEFASAEPGVPSGFEVGGLNMHHGPGLLASGTMVRIDPLEYRDLQYFYGSYVISLRLVRPTRLQFWVQDSDDGGTEVTLQLDSLVKSWFRPLWEMGNRVFWQFFGFWIERTS